MLMYTKTKENQKKKINYNHVFKAENAEGCKFRHIW